MYFLLFPYCTSESLCVPWMFTGNGRWGLVPDQQVACPSLTSQLGWEARAGHSMLPCLLSTFYFLWLSVFCFCIFFIFLFYFCCMSVHAPSYSQFLLGTANLVQLSQLCRYLFNLSWDAALHRCKVCINITPILFPLPKWAPQNPII